MFKQTGLFLTAVLAANLTCLAAEPPATAPAKKAVVYVIPVKGEINTPTLYILRRGLKEAIEQKADLVMLDINTRGGGAEIALSIMEALEKFPGATASYVNREAISAGAFIAAATGDIYFAPGSVMGSAAPVTGSGEDIPETMRLKYNSYLMGRVRAVTEGKTYRGEVVSAMIDKDYELKIDGTVIKAKGILLNLTATEAAKTYGTPPQPLLAAGITKNIDKLLSGKFGAGNYVIQNFQVTWSEKLAQYLNAIAPVLLGLGLLALFIEFKTPGFGIFGIAGIVLLAIVFISNYVAGFSGHEPLLLFALGLVMVVVELIFFPGVALVAVAGLVLMLGALVWAMADLWPGVPFTTSWSGDAFAQPLQNLGLGLLIAVAMGLALARFLPKGWVWDKLILGSAIGGSAQIAGGAPHAGDKIAALIGQRGLAVTMLRPSGQVEVNGQRYEAKTEIGGIDTGEMVVVSGRTDFGLIVERDRT